MQSAISHSEEFINQEESECDKQFSHEVIEYQNQVENIIAWLFSKEEQLQQLPHESTLQEAAFSEILKEYSRHEKFISEFCEFCQTIMKCKEDGQEMRENADSLTDEDRDEIGIQMDAMLVCYEKLKFLATDRLHNLQKILEIRQQTKIERFEEWLSAIEMKIASSNNIGPDYDAIIRQLDDMTDLRVELEQKQDFLNFMSSVIIFDEVDSESLQIQSRSCESLDGRLEGMNRRWIEICRFVDDRNERLKKAESIWKILNSEGPQLTSWLKKLERSLQEVSDALRNFTDIQNDSAFIAKLLTRSDKIDLDIKNKQTFYTSLESRVRTEIERFDDPCSMLVIELEKKLEDLQDSWNAIINRKRMIDYRLQALSNPLSNEQPKCSMIPLPDPITSTSNNDLQFNDPLNVNEFLLESNQLQKQIFNNSSPPSSGNDEKESSLQINSSFSDPRAFDNSLSSDTRSLIYGNNQGKEPSLYYNDNDSQDGLSSTSMTASFPIHLTYAPRLEDGGMKLFKTDSTVLPQSLKEMHHESYFTKDSDDYISHLHAGEHYCRVEKWKHSLESFSTWLKKVETSLCIEDTLDSIVEEPSDVGAGQKGVWFTLDLDQQFFMLDEIESKIQSKYQDEFARLILQSSEITQDLIIDNPEIDEEKYEADLKRILADIEIRYESVKRCLKERKNELADKNRWNQLLKDLRDSCDYVIELMGQIIPENNIGIDLITLAQQQDQLMHAKADLEENSMITKFKQEAKLFLKLCDTLQQNQNLSFVSPTMESLPQNQGSLNKSRNYNLWLSIKDVREDIEVQLDRLSLHCSELSQLIDDRLLRLNEVHKEMHSLQYKMQELATRLQVAEILKSNWLPIENLTVEKLSEQLEDLKLYRERISETESIYKMMNSIFDWMTQSGVPLSQQNLKRINELNTIWSLIQSCVEERQKLIEQDFDNQGASEQRFLEQTIADLPDWERRVATSRVPYFIDHNSNKTNWDHPKFEDLLKAMGCVKQVVFAAYRTALKLRMLQKKFGIDLLMLEQLKEIIEYSNYDQDQQPQHDNNSVNLVVGTTADIMLGVEQVILLLKAIYERIKSDEKASLDVPLSIDLTLNWLLNLYDSTRTGYISVLSLKVGLALICCATREEKYTYMFGLVKNQRTGNVDARKLGTLLETCMRIPVYLGEGDSFGGTEIIETSIRNCFSMSKFNPQCPNSIDFDDYMTWLKSEPQFILWLPVLHRLLISENTTHRVKCGLCGADPIIGLRYRCLKCFKFSICQNCFLTGRHIYEHFDPSQHPMQEYCSLSSSGENVRDLTKILCNKIRPKPTQKGFKSKR